MRAAKSAIATLGMLTRWRWSEVSLATRRATRMRGLKEPCVTRAGAADLAGQLVGLLHLREDLGFADDHAVEAGGDAEQVPHDVVVFERHQFAADFVDRHVVEIGQSARAQCRRRVAARVGGGGVELDAIAGREQHGLGVGMGRRARRPARRPFARA